jgi:hypothetical protein
MSGIGVSSVGDFAATRFWQEFYRKTALSAPRILTPRAACDRGIALQVLVCEYRFHSRLTKRPGMEGTSR